MDLKQAWADWVDADDYEKHMAGVGQAQANAGLVDELVGGLKLEPGAAVLLAGAGSGQMFDFVPAERFAPYRLTCSDISRKLLDRLSARVRCEAVLDDVEDTQLQPGYAAIVLVLVLEHVNWRRALQSLARLEPRDWIIVVQQNPPEFSNAVTPGRTPAGTMAVFAGAVKPQLLDRDELAAELSRLGWRLSEERSRAVADRKQMLGLRFTRADG